MRKIELKIIALANSESTDGKFVLILEERDGLRRLPIIIGTLEAQAIAIALQEVPTSRPQTHDLFKNTLEQADVSIKEVQVSEVQDQVFHAKLIGTKADGSPFEVDARSSDAIALAVRYQCPIYTTEAVLQENGITQENPAAIFVNTEGDLSRYSLKELQQMLQQVLAQEDYERASKLRDAIKKRG